MTAPGGWHEMAERGSLAGLRLVVACHRLFGRSFSLLCVHLVVAYYFLTGPTARAASRAYLRRIASHPEGAAALGRAPGLLASFLHFRCFALSILDRIELWLVGQESFDFETQGLGAYLRRLPPGQGGLVVGAHLGSFDALRALAQRDGMRVNVLMSTRNARRIHTLLSQLSPEQELRVIEAGEGSHETSLRIRACIARGEHVALLADRIGPGPAGRSCRVSLLGDPVSIPEAPFRIATLLGCPLLLLVALRSGTRRYRVYAEQLAGPGRKPAREREKAIGELAAAYASRLEHHCLRTPYQWFNFFDFWQDGL